MADDDGKRFELDLPVHDEPGYPLAPVGGRRAPSPPPPRERLDKQKVAAARYWAAERYPYLATALFATRVVEAPGAKGLAVDPRWRLYADPQVVNPWSVEELGSVLVHHVGHLLRDHAGRAHDLAIDLAHDHKAEEDWVTAADAELNDDLAPSGLRMPGEPVTPEALGFEAGRLAEEYFLALRERRGGEGQGESDTPRPSGDCGSGADGRPREWDEPGGDGDGKAMSKDAANLLRCKVASEVLQQCRRGQGHIPLGLERWARELLEPKLDWRRVLAAEIRRGVHRVAGQVDYTYQRRSRRSGAVADVLLPGLYQPQPEVAIVCDTSGSMGSEQLAEVLAEVDGILKAGGSTRNHVTVLSVDAVVHGTQKVSDAKQVRLLGGGGTDMGEGLRAAMALRPRPSLAIVLTDGQTPWPDRKPRELDVVVALIGGLVTTGPPWARTVVVEDATA